MRYILRNTYVNNYFHISLWRNPQKYYHHFDQPCIQLDVDIALFWGAHADL